MSDELFEAIEACPTCFVYEAEVGGEFHLCQTHRRQFEAELDANIATELARRAAS